MSHREQAPYVGVQGVFWNLGRIIATGLLVSLTGILHGRMGLGWVQAWTVVMGVAGRHHGRVLRCGTSGCCPRGGQRRRRAAEPGRRRAHIHERLHEASSQKKSIWMMIAVAYFYRFGEGLIEKIGPLFLLDTRRAGRARARQRRSSAAINGTYGTVAFIVGALLGGLFSARMGLRATFFVLPGPGPERAPPDLPVPEPGPAREPGRHRRRRHHREVRLRLRLRRVTCCT